MLILRTIMLLMMAGLFVSLLLLAAYSFGRYVGNRNTKKKGKEGKLPTDAGVRDMLLEGRIQDAIDSYRKFTGVDVFTAEKAIDEMLREMRLDDDLRHEIKNLLKSGNKAGAIEAYQDATGATLAEALDYVESHEGRK